MHYYHALGIWDIGLNKRSSACFEDAPCKSTASHLHRDGAMFSFGLNSGFAMDILLDSFSDGCGYEHGRV